MNRETAAKVLAFTGLRDVLSFFHRPHGVLILNYHRIGDGSRSAFDRELWSATAPGFDEQVAFLARHCDVIAPSDLTYALGRSRGRHVMITFDDGYRDNHDIAFPVLRRHGVPAAFFIATGFIDQRLLPWWDAIAMQVRETGATSMDLAPWQADPLGLDGDRESAIRQVLGIYKGLSFEETRPFLERLAAETGISPPASVDDEWMDWDMIRAMARGGMTIGGHTVTHPILSSLQEDAQREEIEGCARRLHEELGIAMTHFAYPVGSRTAFNDDTRRLLREAGVRQAFSFYGGMARMDSDLFDLQRIAVGREIGRDLFRAMVELPQVFCRQAA